MLNNLSKEDRKRHFPNKDGGKGDCRFRGRRGSKAYNEESDKYKSNYDKIDWSKK